MIIILIHKKFAYLDLSCCMTKYMLAEVSVNCASYTVILVENINFFKFSPLEML